MRSLFLALILTNLVYLGWNQMQHPDRIAPPAGLAVPAGIPTLILLSEAGAEVDDEPTRAGPGRPRSGPKGQPRGMGPQGGEPDLPGAERERPAGAHCFTLGPFVNRALVERTAQRMGQAGLAPQVRKAEQHRPSTYWVFLPPQRDRKAAQRIVERLVAAGVEDYYVVRQGAQNNAISLGLFSREAGAQQRLDEVRALGLSPRLQLRYRPETVYWLDYRRPDAQPVDPRPWSDGGDTESPVAVYDRPCEEIASPQGNE